MSRYSDALTEAMDLLANDKRTIFMGQSVAIAGTAMRNTLVNLSEDKLIELPVEEDFQMGIATGFALTGMIPVSIFPRWNFLLLATNQIVNHLDKLREITGLSPAPKVLIRTGIGSISPFHPGPQHVGDFTEAFKLMCPSMNIVRLDFVEQIVPEYEKALLREDGKSTILIEWSDKYAD